MTISPYLNRKIQEKLQVLGFYQGNIDEDMDIVTQQAIWSALDKLTPKTIAVNIKPSMDGMDSKGKPKPNRAVHTLVWHCTATPEGREFSRQQIKNMHLARGFSDIGYHKLIHLDGSVDEGRSEDVEGAHVAGFNKGSLGYSYVGGLGSDGKPKDTRTEQQKATMLQLSRDAVGRYDLKQIVGHRDLSKDLDRDGVVEPHEWVKVCPCFNAPAEYRDLIE